MRLHRIIGNLAPIAIAVVLAGCRHGDAAPAAPPPTPVGVSTVLVQAVREWDEFNGRVRAIDGVELRPRVSGYVERIAYREGEEVQQGDLLFVIDPRPYRAALDSAIAQLERARATARLAQAQDRRAQTLLQAKATSSEDAETRQASYAQSQADVHAAEAAVAMAKLNLGFTEVHAPISGRASRALLTVGNLAVADQTLLTTLVSQDPVYVYFDPDEQSYLHYREQARQAGGAEAARTVRVELADEQDFPHAGTLDFLDNQVDPATGTIHARALLRNTDRVFTPGLYARVRLAGGSETRALLIDDKAVLTDQDRKYVYVLGPGNKALRRDIQLGRQFGGLRVVSAGLKPGDKIIVYGTQKIFYPGAPVQPTEVPMAAVDASAPVASAQ